MTLRFFGSVLFFRQEYVLRVSRTRMFGPFPGLKGRWGGVARGGGGGGGRGRGGPFHGLKDRSEGFPTDALG